MVLKDLPKAPPTKWHLPAIPTHGQATVALDLLLGGNTSTSSSFPSGSHIYILFKFIGLCFYPLTHQF